MTNPRLLPTGSNDASPWDQVIYSFLIEKGNRSGSRAARMRSSLERASARPVLQGFQE